MNDALFFQGNGQSIVPAGNGHRAMTFTGRCLWIKGDDEELIAHVAAAGFEQIQPEDPRYQLAQEKGALFRGIIKAAGLE